MPAARTQKPAHSATSRDDAADGPSEDAPRPAPREDVGSTAGRRPSLPPVNTRPLAASNTKEARIREAEEDRVLIAKAQAGDMVAFRRLVERHQRRAFAIALSLVRDENDARELVQDAFLRVYKALGTFQG